MLNLNADEYNDDLQDNFIREHTFGIMSQYDTMFEPKINVGHCGLYFMVRQCSLYIFKTMEYMNKMLWDYGSVRT